MRERGATHNAEEKVQGGREDEDEDGEDSPREASRTGVSGREMLSVVVNGGTTSIARAQKHHRTKK